MTTKTSYCKDFEFSFKLSEQFVYNTMTSIICIIVSFINVNDLNIGQGFASFGSFSDFV